MEEANESKINNNDNNESITESQKQFLPIENIDKIINNNEEDKKKEELNENDNSGRHLEEEDFISLSAETNSMKSSQKNKKLNSKSLYGLFTFITPFHILSSFHFK